jgi:hypothetical protein
MAEIRIVPKPQPRIVSQDNLAKRLVLDPILAKLGWIDSTYGVTVAEYNRGYR